MEDLNVSGMLKNRKLSRAIHSASWFMLSLMIEYKCGWNHRTFHKIHRWFPSSKLCSNCGHKMDSMDLSIREWQCPNCHVIHDRDINAAINIKREGQRDLYNEIIPKQLGNWDSVISIPKVLQKLSNKIERSSDYIDVIQGSEQILSVIRLDS
jgi:transposase